MKILLIAPIPPPINGCSLANQILINNIKNNPEISFKLINTNTNTISSNQIGRFSIKKIFSFIKSYKEIFAISSVDIIYSTPGQTFFGIAKYIPFYLAALLMSKPYIIHIHGNHLGNEFKSLTGFKKKMFSFFIKNADAGIVLSKLLRPNFHGLLNDNQVYEVANFAEDQLIIPYISEKPKDKLRLLYLSNLMHEKGIYDFLSCLEILENKNIPYEANIAGKIEDESNEKLTLKLNKFKKHLTYHGVVQGAAKKSLLLKSNIFVMPTYYRMEGQPISIIEAMATGNIIVTTNYSGIPDIVTIKNGFFIEAKNPESIANTLIEISSNLDYLVSKISMYNIKYARETFTETKFANNVLNVINEVSRIRNIQTSS